MKKIITTLLILLTILTVPIQSGKAEIVSNVSEYSEAEKETLSTDEPKKTQEEEIEQEIINEENNSEEETNKDIEDVPTETDDNEASFQNESNEPASEKEEIKEEQMAIEQNQPQLESNNTEDTLDDYPVENKQIEDNKEDSNDVTKEEVEEKREKEENETEANISEQLDKSNEIILTQSLAQSVYEDDASLTVNRTSQTNETISLSLVFEGEPTIDEGVVYINFKFPDEIELSEENIVELSAQYDVLERYGILIILPLGRIDDDGEYASEEIHRIDNTIYLRYEIEDSSTLLNILWRKLWGEHTFTLNITLKNSAFSLEGEHQYIFQAIGTQVENPTSVSLNEISEGTEILDISETGGLTLISVPDILQFQTIEIGSDSYVPLVENSNHIVDINDTRIFNENWTLTAQSTEPFTSSNSELAPLRIGILEENDSFQSMSDALTIAESTDNQSPAVEIDLNNLNNREIVVVIDNFNLISNEAYSTTIEWTLSDAP